MNSLCVRGRVFASAHLSQCCFELSEQGSTFLPGMGPYERENYCVILHEKQTGHLTFPLWKALIKHVKEQKRAEQQLKASEEHFRILAETFPQLVWTTQPDGVHEYTNQYEMMARALFRHGYRRHHRPDSCEHTQRVLSELRIQKFIENPWHAVLLVSCYEAARSSACKAIN
jgi:hypothetical protein